MHPALLTLIGLFALLGHGYFWVAIVNRLHAWAGLRTIIDLSTLASSIAFLVLPFVVGWQWWLHSVTFFNAQSLGLLAQFSLVYFLACAFFGFGKLLAKFVGDAREDDLATVLSKQQRFIEPAQLFSDDTVQGAFAKLLTLLPGNQALRMAIDTKRLLIPRLPAELASLRVVHISDFHITGKVGPAWFKYVADAVNTLDADVILVTGDLVENEECLSWLIESMKNLRAKHGIYFVLGNHDFYIDAEQTVRELSEIGWKHVGGKAVVATWNNCPVLIAGNEVPWQRQLADLRQAEQGLKGRPFRIMLMHTPDQFDWACSAHGDLALAGHNHGGQVCFPILGAVAAPSLYGTRFAGGTFRRGNTVMHVTRGISGETPLRWGCPPEIALLELTAKAN